jgi:hypothetical protein
VKGVNVKAALRVFDWCPFWATAANSYKYVPAGKKGELFLGDAVSLIQWAKRISSLSAPNI